MHHLRGRQVPIGPLDNAFVLNRLDPASGTPLPPWGVVCPVEVKNIREWVYPRTQELYQVLTKAALLQQADPDEPLLPILVTRRAHSTTKYMAKHLGFFVIEAKRQFLPASDSRIDPTHFAEVRAELGLTDLTLGWDDTSAIEQGLVSLQQKYDVRTALERWQSLVSDRRCIPLFRTLNDDLIGSDERGATMERLRAVAEDLGLGHSWG